MLKKQEDKCWIEIHQVCGDCGRRYKEVFIIRKDKESQDKLLKVLKPYLIKYNMACKNCSAKHFEEETKKSSHNFKINKERIE